MSAQWYNVFDKSQLSKSKIYIFIVIVAVSIVSLLLLGITQIIDIAIALLLVAIIFPVSIIFFSMIIGDKQQSLTKSIKDYFSEEGTKALLAYNVITVSSLVAIFFWYGLSLNLETFAFSGFYAFLISLSVVIVRLVVLFYSKYKEDEFASIPSYKKINYLINWIILGYILIMMFNIVYDFRLFNMIGIAVRWIDEMLFSFDSILIVIVAFGIYQIITRTKYRNFLKKGHLDDNITGIMIVIIMIVSPILLIIFLFPSFMTIDLNLLGGYFSTLHFESQASGVTDWFGFVFWMLLQAPASAFMIAYMGITAIAVMFSRSFQGAGQVVVGAVVAIAGSIGILIVFSALTGSIPAPLALSEELGFDPAIASFIYALTLIMTYVISISIMGVFISTTGSLLGEWGGK